MRTRQKKSKKKPPAVATGSDYWSGLVKFEPFALRLSKGFDRRSPNGI